MPRSPARLADSFAPIGLAELDAAAALRERVDVKYVVEAELLAALAERLRDTHAVLEIEGRRAFAYRTTYFDTAELRTYRDHVQQRRRRYKCRAREYVDSGDCAFEVKLKAARGRTVKHRMPYDRERRDELSEPALEFVRRCLAGAYGRALDGELLPVLAMAYTRVTLVAPELGERVTWDYDLAFSGPDGASGRLADGLAIVESKSRRGNAVADRALRSLGARPEAACSKFCLGVGFTNPGVNSNGLRPLLRRHFRAAPAAAVALALGGAAPAAAAELPRVDVRAAAQIRDEPRTPARLTVGGRTYRVGIELRGQASLRHPKRSYKLEAERRVRLLGMPRERDWDLNAYYNDPTLLRDVLAHAAARRMGVAASRARHVELWVNRRYRGVYVLIEPPELSDRRVRGEALLELTGEPKLDRGDHSFRSATGRPVRHVEPERPGKRDARAARRALRAFEAALPGAGWRAHLDERSAVDYVLHAELLKNQDVFYSSTYVHLRSDGKLALGPVWDFDVSSGNTVDPATSAPEGWLSAGRPWADALLADPGFRAALAARWRALRADGLLEHLLAELDRHAGALSAPAERNFARWPTLGRPLFRNQPVYESHAAAVAALRAWLVQRAAWLDATTG